MFILNGVKFAKNDDEFVSSLFELANLQGYDVYTSGRAGITLKGKNKQLYFNTINECLEWLNSL